MAETWYYARDGQQLGPVSREQLQQLLRDGQVRPDDLVWSDGMPSWQPAGSISSLGILPIPVVQMQPAPYASPSPMLGYYAPAMTGPRPGGFWIRFVAAFVDGLILIVPNLVLTFGVQMLFGIAPWQRISLQGMPAAIMTRVFTANIIGQILTLLLYWVYFATMESSSKQATFGKRACQLYVTDSNHGRLSFGQASLRAAMKQLGSFAQLLALAVILVAGPDSRSMMVSSVGSVLAAAIVLVGYCMAAFTDRKRALHDMIAGTLVVRR